MSPRHGIIRTFYSWRFAEKFFCREISLFFGPKMANFWLFSYFRHISQFVLNSRLLLWFSEMCVTSPTPARCIEGLFRFVGVVLGEIWSILYEKLKKFSIEMSKKETYSGVKKSKIGGTPGQIFICQKFTAFAKKTLKKNRKRNICVVYG